MSTDTLPAPVAVWDTRDRGSFFWDRAREGQFMQAVEWARRHIPRPEDTYRVEFYLLDGPFAVVHKYALLEDEGFKYLDLAAGEAAVEPPVIVPLAELPPEHLLRGS